MTYPARISGIAAPTRSGLFRRRRNRFVVELDLLPEGVPTTASLPNPGRMEEMLLPGIPLGLTPGPPDGRHPWKVRSLELHGRTVPLDTGSANRVARWLLDHRLVPGLEEWEVDRAEVSLAGQRSRVDFRVRHRDGTAPTRLLEVKSSTLVNGEWALFPDAVTERGRRHVEHLAATDGAIVLVLAHAPQARHFAPDVHVDLRFSRTLHAVRDRISIVPLALDWTADLALADPPRLLTVPWPRIEPVLEDRGSYLVLFHVPSPRRITVGGLGDREFSTGFYLYVGSAMRGLSARVARHRSARVPTRRWHVDWLHGIARAVADYPIREPDRREEMIAARVADLADSRVPGFGSSDSSMDSHLFHFHNDPRQLSAFQSLILELRRHVFAPRTPRAPHPQHTPHTPHAS